MDKPYGTLPFIFNTLNTIKEVRLLKSVPSLFTLGSHNTAPDLVSGATRDGKVSRTAPTYGGRLELSGYGFQLRIDKGIRR